MVSWTVIIFPSILTLKYYCAIYVYFSLYNSISMRNISFRYCLRTINMLILIIHWCH